jgi:hypothetical protein
MVIPVSDGVGDALFAYTNMNDKTVRVIVS